MRAHPGGFALRSKRGPVGKSVDSAERRVAAQPLSRNRGRPSYSSYIMSR